MPEQPSACAEALSEIERLQRALRTLSACNRALVRAEDEAALLRDICRVIVEEGGYRLAWVSRAEHDEEKTVTPVACWGVDEGFLAIKRTWREDSERGKGPNPVAIRTGEPCIVRDIRTDPNYPFWRDEAARRGYVSVIALPLRIEGAVGGALSIYAPEPDAFDPEEVKLLTELADDLAYGIETLRERARRRRAEEELHRLNRAHRTLAASNHALLHAQDEESLLKEICRVVVEEAGYRSAYVTRAEDDEACTLRPVAWAGVDQDFLDALRLSWADEERGRGASGTAVRTGEPAVIRNVATDPNVMVWKEEFLARGYASLIALPLRVDGRIFGALAICAPEPDAFDAAEVELLKKTAQDLSYGLSALLARARAREAEETIRRMAYFDPLTGLLNRVSLGERLEQVVAESRAQNRSFALLHLEVGRFREINETLGYREGDALLKEIGSRLSGVVGEGGIVARVGEGEFALLLPRVNAEKAIQFAQRLLVALYDPVELSGLQVDARAHIGIALFPGHGTEPDVLMRRASMAAYQARRRGSGFAVYAGALDSDSTRRLELMGDLRRAIEHHELLLYCQPKVRMASRRVCGAEALVRWRHTRHGMINPGEFIKLAEGTGLITPLTYWVLEAALRQRYAWRERGVESPLAVNLSARDLHDPQLLDRVNGLFATWGARPDWIQFELTESALMDDPAGSLETLRRLKDLGVELLIDDFGTGYSSLAYLQRLPVDTIKIDQSFVGRMVDSADSAVIVRSTIELAHSLDLEVVAEGVENQAIWGRLAELGCDIAQGYCISAPIPADEFPAWEARSPWIAG
ncbi:bifunctional diguanylate cyclase/phosphodiesterase [Pelomicrobium sp. G1]|uniref:bifunctional diguanylate cyclase/phosphodiesterase n=1 Tax=unclassified Pelomicrobium TaxID=2815318 RepID=UPI003F775B10